jgi:hypothetical protein
MGNPLALSIGPGILRMASSLSATEPTDLSTAWTAEWLALGYTDEGSEFSVETKFEDITVAEELDPVLILATSRIIMVSFALAEITATNLKRVWNGGTITNATGCVYYDPVALGAEQFAMLGWESDDHQERWILRKVIQTGKVTIARKKAPDKATLPAEFRAMKPASLDAFRVIEASPGRA